MDYPLNLFSAKESHSHQGKLGRAFHLGLMLILLLLLLAGGGVWNLESDSSGFSLSNAAY
jgi:hypothetical protein